MENTLIQLFAAFTGSLGFAILFRLSKRHLFSASLGGMLTWLVYLIIRHYYSSVFIPYFIASVFARCYAEFMAHLHKAPNTLFTVSAVVPLIPGSGLYYTMSSAVAGETMRAAQTGKDTALTALAIAAGSSIVMTVRFMFNKRKEKTI